MGKGSRLGAGPCAKQQEADPRPADPPPPPEARPDSSRVDAWSPLIRSSLVSESPGSKTPSRRELRSAWGAEPLHPRKTSSRRLRLTQIAEERRERKG